MGMCCVGVFEIFWGFGWFDFLVGWVLEVEVEVFGLRGVLRLWVVYFLCD